MYSDVTIWSKNYPMIPHLPKSRVSDLHRSWEDGVTKSSFVLRVRHWQMLDKFFDSGELKLAIFMTPQKWRGGGVTSGWLYTQIFYMVSLVL